MLLFRNIENRFVIIISSFILISIIGALDYFTGVEISFSIFYLIPIIFHALYKNVTKTLIIINTIFASSVWLLAEYLTREYTHNLIPFWNAFVRFSIFAIVGLLAFNLKEKYKRLAKLNNELMALNDEKNKFIGIAAHDLRNPIGNILSFSDLLISKYSNNVESNDYEIIRYINELSNDTLDLLGKLLNISKIESGVVEISSKLQDYVVFIKKYRYLNQIVANKKEIVINFRTTHEEIILPFDEHYLSEVINNLLTNAIKFSYQKSGIVVSISITEKNFVRTEIIDEGKGIPMEEQTMLFKYFQKSSTQPTDGESSTGLGLAIAKKIVITHNGIIGVKSEIGKGSNFYFELPLKR